MTQISETDRVRQVPTRLARDGSPATYTEIGNAVGLSPRSRYLHNALDNISRSEHEADKPLLSAVVIRVAEGFPGDGFFKLATELRTWNGQGRVLFWRAELTRVSDYWRDK